MDTVAIVVLFAIAGIVAALLTAFYRDLFSRHLPGEPTTEPMRTPAPDPLATWATVERRARLAARLAARHDFAHGQHRRPNPHPRHSREFACWAIAYGDAWLDLELAAFPGVKPDLL
jgi:hypothetical protein